MKQNLIRIVYSIKDDRGFITDKVMTFSTHKEAVDFLKYLSSQNTIGNPVMEVK